MTDPAAILFPTTNPVAEASQRCADILTALGKSNSLPRPVGMTDAEWCSMTLAWLDAAQRIRDNS